jgi:hypothetical protein
MFIYNIYLLLLSFKVQGFMPAVRRAGFNREPNNQVLGEKRPDCWEKKVELTEKKSPLPSLVAEMDGKVVGFILGGASGWEYGVPENIG